MSLRVLVADDASLFRRVMVDLLSTQADLEVVGSAPNGKIAVQKVRDLRPDLLTLDLEMPEMDGLATLEALRREGLSVATIVVSALSRHGGDLTMRALALGAFDFITKPSGSDPAQSRQALLRDLVPRIRAVANRHAVRSILHGGPVSSSPVAAPASRPAAALTRTPEFVLIGVSTGGPVALAQLLPRLPGALGVPVFIVQHMPPIFTQSLAESLNNKCALTVKEAADGDVAMTNTVYLAPGGRQMRLASLPDGKPRLEITDDLPENNCRPSVDYLFRSVAHAFPGRGMAVMLTGMGNDGTLGMRLLKRHGCFTIAQDESTCVVYGMPRAAVEAGVIDVVLPLPEIAGRITAAVTGRAL